MKRRLALISLSAALAACSSGGAPADESAASSEDEGGASAPASTAPDPVTLTYLIGDDAAVVARTDAIVAAYTALNPHVTIEVEQRPGGGEGDNIVKTRLSTGEMTDVFQYNSGSLLQALNPAETLVDLAGEPFIDNIVDSYLPTVSQGDAIFGVPVETAMGGGILYNRAIYEELDLEVPTTWDEFAANNEAILDAGTAAPVGQTYADTWTSQLFILADFYNVQAAEPDFAEQYTLNEAHYADTPAARRGFELQQQAFEEGWYQEDFGAATFDDGLNMLATGEIAHYPMLTFALGTIAENHPDTVEDIGFFGIPGDDPENHGATIWMPSATYIAQTSENVDAAKDFLAFIASVEGTEAMTEGIAPAGPYMIEGAGLPSDVLPAVLDIQAYIDSGNTAPALEFLSPIKGPQLEFICVEVGSGLRTAEDAAALYDEDVARQGEQLGLPGW
jgi:raffinose/stachyose/melibiose transport system substrate-binding protein